MTVPHISRSSRRPISRRNFWLVSGAVIFLLLIAIWFLMNFERVPHDVHTPPKAEAQRNPYLAAQRLLHAYGYQLSEPPGATDHLERHLPAQGTLFLAKAREFYMTTERSQQLLHWVEQGGYLILESGYASSHDPLLKQLDVQVLTGDAALSPEELQKKAEAEQAARQSAQDNQSTEPGNDEEGEDEENNHFIPHTPKKKSPPPVLNVKIPGYARTLQVAPRYNALQAGQIAPSWSSDSPERAKIMHLAYGRGQITLVNCFCRFTNGALSKQDHAELLLALVHTYQPRGSVMWIHQLEIPSLWEWLSEHAWPAVISAIALIGFWLWRIIPRFGVIQPEPLTERRSLLEHLRGIGRFMWRTRALDVLLQVTRQQVFALLQRHRPEWAQLSPPQQAQAIAQYFDFSTQNVALALHHPLQHPEQFTQAIRLLKQLEHLLNKGKHHGTQ